MFSQGDFLQTENPLDLVIEDAGFFQVLRPDGTTAYTRAGAFKKDGTGRVVTSDGFPLQPGITIPADATSVTVGTDGTVSVTTPGQTTAQQVGSIQLARFVNPGGLIAIGRNLFIPTPASGDAIVANPGIDGMGTLAQGFLEMSNVKVVEEMVVDDHEPARVRGELQGHPDRRRDAGDGQQHEALAVRLIRLVGLAALVRRRGRRVAGMGGRDRACRGGGDGAGRGDLPRRSRDGGGRRGSRRAGCARSGSAPPPRRAAASASIPDYLRLRLSEPQLLPEHVQLIVPEQVVVTRAFQVVTGAAIVEAASRQIQERLELGASSEEPYAVTALSRPADLRVPVGIVEIVAQVPVEPPAQGAMGAAVTVKVDGRSYQTMP